MRTLLVLATIAFVAANANAHPMSEHGNILLLTEDQVGLGLGSTIEGNAPGTIPNGLIWFVVNGVQGGDSFTILADDGQEPQVVGLADSCPGPDWSPEGLASGEDSPEEIWIVCNLIPDFDVYFTGGEYGNGPGDESGTVPGDGAAVVVLFEGDAGEGFTYTEA